MRSVITLIVSLFFSVFLFGQTEIEVDCLHRIQKSSKNTLFPRAKGIIVIKGDTIECDKSRILLADSSPEALTIFKQGLLSPDLILGAATDGSGNFKIGTSPFLGTLSINSFDELKVTGNPRTIKTFSFLLWREKMANPMLYILELKNEKANPKMNGQDFIKGARLSSFGFCSILI